MGGLGGKGFGLCSGVGVGVGEERKKERNEKGFGLG